jgi:hypothetical protein
MAYILRGDDIHHLPANLTQVLACQVGVALEEVGQTHECVIAAGEGLPVHGLRHQQDQSLHSLPDVVSLSNVTDQAVGEMSDLLLF